MRRARVLLVEDHTIMRQGTRQLLEAEAGFEVIGEAADGEEALRLAELLRPDILVLDINLPRLHGEEVARRLRAAMPGLRIVVLTGYDGEQYARAFLRLGVDGYLVKTATGQELAQALRAVQAGRRYVQPAVAATLESAPDDDPPTPRELATLRLVAEGRRNAEVAATLHIKERTVRFHLDNLFRKCGVASRTELIRAAQERGWLALAEPRNSERW